MDDWFPFKDKLVSLQNNEFNRYSTKITDRRSWSRVETLEFVKVAIRESNAADHQKRQQKK